MTPWEINFTGFSVKGTSIVKLGRFFELTRQNRHAKQSFARKLVASSRFRFRIQRGATWNGRKLLDSKILFEALNNWTLGRVPHIRLCRTVTDLIGIKQVLAGCGMRYENVSTVEKNRRTCQSSIGCVSESKKLNFDNSQRKSSTNAPIKLQIHQKFQFSCWWLCSESKLLHHGIFNFHASWLNQSSRRLNLANEPLWSKWRHHSVRNMPVLNLFFHWADNSK